MAEESFGQTVVLTKRIASVLRGYPEGPASLNELLQNADDAGATSVALCLDMRQHPRDGLRYPGLADFQGTQTSCRVGVGACGTSRRRERDGPDVQMGFKP